MVSDRGREPAPLRHPGRPPPGSYLPSSRLVNVVVGVVVTAFAVNAMQYVVAQDSSLSHVLPAVICLLIMVTLQLRVFSDPRTPPGGTRARLALVVQALVALLPIGAYGTGWTGMQGFLAADALLVLRPAMGWAAFVVIAIVGGAMQYRLSDALIEAAYITVSTAVVGLVVYGLSRLRTLVGELETARTTLALLVVEEEQARFTFDLDRSLGTSLAVIARRLTAARRAADSDPGAVDEEIVEVLAVSRQALQDVRMVASNYREAPVDHRSIIRLRVERLDALGPDAAVPSRRLRMGAWLASAVFGGYGVNAVILVLAAGLDTSAAVAAITSVVVSVAVVLRVFVFSDSGARPAWKSALVVLVLVLTTATPILLNSNAFLVVPGMLAGTLLLVLPARWSVPLFACVAVGMGTAHAVLGGGGLLSTYGLLVTINQGLVVMALSRLQRVVHELHETRVDVAATAIGGERDRFSRDVHDLLGFSFSAITLKSELARALVHRDPGAMKQELDEVLDLTRAAVADARVLTKPVRQLSIMREIASSQALLAALGASVEVVVRAEDLVGLGEEVTTALALVVREGVTNVARHSNARNCSLKLKRANDRVVLEIENDGVRSVADIRRSGLANLAARMSALGGELHAGPTSGTGYRLEAIAPA